MYCDNTYIDVNLPLMFSNEKNAVVSNIYIEKIVKEIISILSLVPLIQGEREKFNKLYQILRWNTRPLDYFWFY